MPDNKYCYPNSDFLINKLNIKDKIAKMNSNKIGETYDRRQ